MRDSNSSISIDTQQLKAVFETAVDCLIIIDANGIISKINPTGANLFGYTPTELIEQNINILMATPHHKQHDNYLAKYQKTGIKKMIGIGREVTGKKKDGTLFPCHLNVNEFFVQNKKCFAGILHDLTLRKKNEEEILSLNQQLQKKIDDKNIHLSKMVGQLSDINQQLEYEILERKKIEAILRTNELELRKALEKEKELNDLKSRFLSTASHEFRTPLSTILSSSILIEKYLQKGKLENTEKHFGKVKSSIHQLNEILGDFLSLTKLTEGKIQASPQRFMLLDFCRDFIETNQGLLKSEQRIEKQLPKNDLELFLDKKILQHILFNLFSNAIKYSKVDGVIHCSIQVANNQLVIDIKDNGIGIPLAEQKHLFERFFRGTNAINIKGTGLGLNIVKEYLNILNGSILFESKENEGTTFTIQIPLSEEI
ncbi:MAG: ATP-binding protein [Saprospiraceae bacterium]